MALTIITVQLGTVGWRLIQRNAEYQKEQTRLEEQLKESNQKQKEIEDEKTKLENEKKDLEIKLQSKAQVRVASATYTPSTSGNEAIVWDFLIKQGFTRNQTAGIMGNLQQEHNFQTSGDGLAQWIGGRKARLMAMPDPYSIHTQLNFLMIELNGSYVSVKNSLMATDDVITATRIFQNQFERCGICNEPNRIRFAQAILGRY